MNITLLGQYRTGFLGYKVDIIAKSLKTFEADLDNCYNGQSNFYTIKATDSASYRKVQLSISFEIKDRLDICVAGFNTTNKSKQENSTYIEVSKIRNTKDMNEPLKTLEKFGKMHGDHKSIWFRWLRLHQTKGTMFWYKFRYLQRMIINLYYETDIEQLKFCKKLKYAKYTNSVFLRLNPKIRKERSEKKSWLSFSFKSAKNLGQREQNLLDLMFSYIQYTEMMMIQRHTRQDVIYLINCLRKERTIEKVVFKDVHGFPVKQVILWNKKFIQKANV